METYKLHKPITADGNTITTLEIDLDSLSINDLEAAQRTVRRLARDSKMPIAVMNLDQRYHAAVAGHACGRDIHFMRNLGAKDYTYICIMVQNFLLGGGSDEDGDDDTEISPQSPIAPSSGKTKASQTSKSA